MILVIDNYDSFSYNLYQLIGSINEDIKVIRNDDLTVEEIIDLNPTHIFISPGPGHPRDAGIIEELVRKNPNIPILGVCLGHQAICEANGAEITRAKTIIHGKQDVMYLEKDPLFNELPETILGARYHSLVATKIPDDLKVIAYDKEKEVMAVKKNNRLVYGLQFHPESIMTPCGKQIIKNFLEMRY